MKRTRTCWPHIHLKSSRGYWYAKASNCNVTGAGPTPQAAYDNWWHWYNMPY